MKIVITVRKNGKSMRWDYTYGTQSQKDFDQWTRTVTLDPIKGEMMMKWEDSGKDVYKTYGLDQFAQSGLGHFSGTELESDKGRLDHGIFDLGPTSFIYKWLTTVDGKNYTMVGLIKLSREVGPTLKAERLQGTTKDLKEK